MLAVLAVLATALSQETVPRAAGPAPAAPVKLAPELRLALQTAPLGEVFRVYAVLDQQLEPAELDGRVLALPKQELRTEVVRRLREFAAPRQARLLELLAELRQRGEVERVRSLWIANTVVFHGTERSILDVAELPEVARIGWDPVREPAAYRDDVHAPDGAGGTVYYAQDFESGTLPPEFTTSTGGCGFAAVSGLHGPGNGDFHLVLASTADGCQSNATAELTLDLSAATTARLRFRFKDMNDEFSPGSDVLEASDDGGATWWHVANLDGPDGLYTVFISDLDLLGLAYVADFKLRWRWSDNFRPPTDGFGIDDIELADVLTPLPVVTEQNVVQLQAPALWSLGFDGGGTVLLNIDSGVDVSHPDLAGRIWTNPLDPIDGLDNDGNDYVDDWQGWDFIDDDNDPDPFVDSHGTSTAGIMVGDGTSGVRRTGMAPGAALAVARIGGETDHWLAQQWGMSVGVDCSSSSHSYKWGFIPKPDYHMHRRVEEVVLAAGIIHANSIGNQGGSPAHPIPFNISAPGLCPAPWRHPVETQLYAGVSAVLACGGIELDDSSYSFSGRGPSTWEDIRIYDPFYPHAQFAELWDYPYGGFGGGLQGLVKPDLVTYTNVMTTSNDGGYTSFGGTSAATPHLGGALALLCSANPAAKPRHVAQALQLSAQDLGPVGKDNVFGAGKLQVRDAALRLFHLVQAKDLAPGIGEELALHVSGFPGDAFRTRILFGEPRRKLRQMLIPEVLATGVLDANGEAEVKLDIPDEPTLIGFPLVFVSTEDNRAGLTGQILVSVAETIVIGP